jgi:lipopolysaccharide export LptBFGC system permease protein LptF
MLLLGIIVGLLIFVVNSISYTLSESEIFNPILGAWWHIILIYLVTTKILITREDG